MRAHNSFQRTRHIPIKLITLLAGLLVLAILSSTVGRASANPTPENGPDPLRQLHPATGQVAPEQDASLSDIDVTVNGESVTLVPPFDPDITQYTATVNAARVSVSASAAGSGAGIDLISVGDRMVSLSPPNIMVTTPADLTEGAITTVSLRVLASDGVTTKTYHLFLSRPADPAVPDITIAADTAEYTAGLGALFLTLTREGDTADSLDVTVNFTQEQSWLSDTSHAATFAAGDAETTLIIVASDFSSSVTQSGELTATVAPVTGYDTSGAIAQLRVISQEGPAVTVTIEHPVYTVEEAAGTLEITLVARAHESISQIGEFDVAVLSRAGTATPKTDDDPGDYTGFSANPRFMQSHFQKENGSLVGRRTVSLAILDDDVIEGDEYFHLDLTQGPGSSEEIARLGSEGNRCGTTCSDPYVVTIRDNDHAVTVTIEHPTYTVDEDAGTLDITLVARAREGVTQIDTFVVSVSSQAGQAVSALDAGSSDYIAVSQTLPFVSTDFEQEEGSLVARRAVSVTIHDDNVHEGDELFHVTLARPAGLPAEIVVLDTEDAQCISECPTPYAVTIQDNDPKPHLVLSTTDDQIHEGGSGTADATLNIISLNGTTYPDNQTITVSFTGGATPGDDYTVAPADKDTMADGHQLTLRKRTMSATFTLTAVDDSDTDPCDWIIVSATLDADGSGIPSPQEIAVVDNEASLQVPAIALPVGLAGTRTGAITEVGGHDWFCFPATTSKPYIIEMKQALTFTPPDGNDLDWNPQQIPGYLVDPSILELVDQDNTQVLDEHDQGGFTLNFARAFFTPDTTGTYYVRVGAGPQDRGATGLYTISVRIDDHADDYHTGPGFALRPGGSIIATINSDVSPDDPRLNPWDWAERGDSAIPRRGIETLDDRDVFRFEIAEAGEYRISVSNQPAGVGIWYIWDAIGNLFAEFQNAPVSESSLHYDPGTYYAVVGTPYESSGNTGTYIVSLTIVPAG